MEKVNQDIMEGYEISSAFDRGLFPVWTSSFEFEELYAYLDSLRQSGTHLDIAGFDCQVSSSNAADYFVPELEKSLKKHNITYNIDDLIILQEQLIELSNGRYPNANCTEVFLKNLQKLTDAMQQSVGLSMLHQSLIGFLGQLNDLFFNNIEQKFKAGQFSISDNNMRDSLMAVQMMYLYNHRYAGRKIIGWGANMHFGNHLDSLNTEHSTARYKSMGYHLKNKLGDKVYILFVTANTNIPGTIEWELANTKIENAFLSNEFLKQSRFKTSGIHEHLTDMEKADMSNLTDGILVTSVNISSDEKTSASLQGIVLDASTKKPIELASIRLSNSSEGIVTDENGKFELEIGNPSAETFILVSCIGYKTKRISVGSILISKRDLKISLTPEFFFLQEVIVHEKAPQAKEIFEEMLDRVSDNYFQSPFNMEFYSNISAVDTLGNNHYQLESIIQTYHDGYKKGSSKAHQVIQKRESGSPFWQGKHLYLKLWPVVELAFYELYSSEINKELYTEKFRDKINLKLSGTKILNKDTVFVLSYDYRLHGELYISARDFALIRHTTSFTSRTARTRAEVDYQKRDGYYFPTSARGEYLHVYKVDRKKRSINIQSRVILQNLILDNVKAFTQNYDFWTTEQVRYNQEFWVKDNYTKH